MWDLAVKEWAVALAAAGRARTTIGTRTDHVRRVGRAIGGDPWAVSGQNLVAHVGAQAWARETRRSVHASLRGFYGWGVATGRTGADAAAGLPRVAPGAAKPRPAPEHAYREALSVADERTRLILRLAGEVGLRRAEVAVIHAQDLVEDLLGWSLVVHGKGQRDRVVPLPVHLGIELRGRGPGWAFPGDDGGHLSPRWVGTLASRALPAGWTMHTLRHRFATRAYAAERDLLAVQQLLGHSTPTTTQRYVAVEADRLRSAMGGAA